MGKLSPEIVNGLKERGVNLTDEEITSINTILRNTPQELSMDQLDQAVGGKLEWKKVAKIGLEAAIIVAAAIGVDYIQSAVRIIRDGHITGYSENMLTEIAIDTFRQWRTLDS